MEKQETFNEEKSACSCAIDILILMIFFCEKLSVISYVSYTLSKSNIMLRLHQCAFFIDIHLFARDDTQHKKCMTLIRKENIKFEYKYLFQKSNKARF